ncbi:MAG: hypothetical protein ACJ71S_02205 [Acidobacteriaceae bacterium]
MRFAFTALLLALLLITPAWSAPRHASSWPVVRHPAHKATTPAGNPHGSRGHIVGPPGTRKHHKWL